MLKSILVVAGASLLYYLAALIGMNLLPGFNTPEWWLPNAARAGRILTWLHLSTWAGLALLSAPLAMALIGLAKAQAARYALLAAVLGLFLPSLLQILPHISVMPGLGWLSTAADLFKFLITLPLLTVFVRSMQRRLS